MIRIKEHKGITPIALVITIIVLLILAGVTINSIMSQDGTPEKAVEARKKNDQGAEFDAIKLAVVGAMGEREDVKVDAESLKNELNGIVEDEGRLAIRDDNAPWVVIGKTGKAYEITEKAVVTEVSGLVLSPRSLTLTIEDDIYEEKTITANLIDIEGTLSWSSSTDIIDITPSQDGKSAVIKAKEGGTETITVTCSNGDVAECVVTVEDEPIYLATVAEIGDYVDIDLNCYNYNKKWRVLSKSGNTENDTVKLISTGVPLTYYLRADTTTAINDLANMNTIQLKTGNGIGKEGFREDNITGTKVLTDNTLATADLLGYFNNSENGNCYKYFDSAKGIHAFGCNSNNNGEINGENTEFEDLYKYITGDTEKKMKDFYWKKYNKL